MSRIKYPNQETINHQIAQILDRSGLFENETEDVSDYNADNEYVQCMPVREKKSVSGYKLIAGVAAVAAAAAMLIAIANYTPIQKSALHPLTSVPEDTTALTNDVIVGDKFRNSDIKVTYKEYSNGISGKNSDRINADGEYICGYLTETLAQIDYNGKNVEHADGMVHEIMNDINAMYDQYYAGEKSGITASYAQNVEDAKLDNTNIVTVTESTTISLSDIKEPYREITMKGANYDVSTGLQLTMDDIFTDTGAGREELNSYLYTEIGKAYSDMNAEDLKYLMETVTDGQWYFSDGNLNVIVNGIQQEQDSGIVVSTFKIFSVPVDNLKYLKSDYK